MAEVPYIHLSELEVMGDVFSRETVPVLLDKNRIGLINLNIDGEIKAILYPSRPVQRNEYITPIVDLFIYFYSDANSFTGSLLF